jgi:hypothetical protein
MSVQLVALTREHLLRRHGEICAEARAIMERKNHDYTNDAQGASSIFGNLALIEELGLGTTEQGIVIRMGDKLSRLATLTTREARVADEGIKDTIKDIINYAVLLLVRRETREPADVVAIR